MRIVSLIASSTEIVCALGCRPWLVGRSHECDYPLSIFDLPVVTKTKFATDGTSYEIDQRIKAILQEGLSVYRVNGDDLKALKPDVIITQTQCEVCAVSEKDVIEATYDWLEYRPTLVSLSTNSLDDLWRDIHKVSRALKVEGSGEKLVHRLKQELAEIRAQTQLAIKKAKKRPTVACIEWINPLMSAGNWVPELVEIAGGINLFGEAGKHSPWMKWEDIVQRDPDILVIMPCGFDITRTHQEMVSLTQNSEWQNLKSVRSNNVFLVDGNQYFNRPGPRLVESAKILSEVFYPDFFSPIFKEKGWKQLTLADQ